MLNLEFAHGCSGFQPIVENLLKGRHGFGGIFAVVVLVTENPPKKITGKSASRKIKYPPAHEPPKSTSQAQKNQQIRLSNLQIHVGFSSIEKVCSWRRLQSMDSGTLFGCLLGMVEAPMLKCTCNPSGAVVARDNVCCALFQTTLLVKSVRLKKLGRVQREYPQRGWGKTP